MASLRLAALAAVLALSATACTQDPSVGIAEAQAAQRAAEAEIVRQRVWSHVGPFGIPAEGMMWIMIVSCVLLAAIIITGMSLLYCNRQGRRAVERKATEGRRAIAIELAKRPNCPACNFDPATYETVQRTVETAERKAAALAQDAT